MQCSCKDICSVGEVETGLPLKTGPEVNFQSSVSEGNASVFLLVSYPLVPVVCVEAATRPGAICKSQ